MPDFADVEDGTTANLAAVLVVGKSNITRVVVSRIVERSGLRPVAEAPESAQRMLARLRPGTVILDGGADNCDCNHLFVSLSDQRRMSGRNVPRVILLSTHNRHARDPVARGDGRRRRRQADHAGKPAAGRRPSRSGGAALTILLHLIHWTI